MLMSHDVNLPSKARKREYVKFASNDTRLIRWHIHNHSGCMRSNPIAVVYTDIPPTPLCATCKQNIKE